MKLEFLPAPRRHNESGLGDRLHEMVMIPGESRADLFERAADVVRDLGKAPLNPDELQYMGRILTNWRFYTGNLHGNTAGVARRDTPLNAAQLRQIDSGRHSTPRRGVGPVGDETFLIADKHLTGEDVAVVFEIEADNTTFARVPARAFPRPPRKPSGNNGVTTRDPVLLREPSGLHLTDREIEVCRLLPLSIDDIARQMKMSAEVAGKTVSYAAGRNDLDRYEFLNRIAEHDLVDLKLLPKQRQYELTDKERQLLGPDYLFESNEIAMRGLQLSYVMAVSRIRRSLATKLGVASVTNRTHIFLTAKRDGVI